MDNSSGRGIGKDREFFETQEGKLIDAKGVKARYLRSYTKGSSLSAFNVHQEIEVYGLPAANEPVGRVGLLLITAGALALRGPQLALRPMHNDEAVNAEKIRRPLGHGSYRYDPNEHHGPTLYYATLPFVWLSGAPDYDHLTRNHPARRFCFLRARY